MTRGLAVPGRVRAASRAQLAFGQMLRFTIRLGACSISWSSAFIREYKEDVASHAVRPEGDSPPETLAAQSAAYDVDAAGVASPWPEAARVAGTPVTTVVAGDGTVILDDSTVRDERLEPVEWVVRENLSDKRSGQANRYKKEDRSNARSLPSVLEKDPTCTANETLSHILRSQTKVGWADGPSAPSWLEAMCPEVVAHFNRFPGFAEYPYFGHPTVPVPVQSTEYAAQTVCTLKVVQQLAASVGARIYLHAGSHIGAIIHGQPIPWDDDTDVMMDYEKKDELEEACARFGSNIPIWARPRVELHCVKGFNALKIWLQPKGMRKETIWWMKHYSPFVDLCFFKIDSGRVWEVNPKGQIQMESYGIMDYFPTRPFYYAGILAMGPQPIISKQRYTLQNCVVGTFNHRLERQYLDQTTCVDCRQLYKIFPFVYNTSIKVHGHVDEQRLYPEVATIIQPLVNVSKEQRTITSSSPGARARQLADLPDMNTIEIDNTISPEDKCAEKHALNVVEFNAGGGKQWLEFAELLKHADVIILRDMDIGMHRSDQQHTTRLLAYYLNMNYAWGFEFAEPEVGKRTDRNSSNASEVNFHGLHGNAILAKCKLEHATIFREHGVGAYGLERQMGGHMMMLARVAVNGNSVVIGSEHNVSGLKREITDYIGTSPAIIVSDQASSICHDAGNTLAKSGLQQLQRPDSCSISSRVRCDAVCSNMKVAQNEYVVKPRTTHYGLNASFGEHALLRAVFALRTAI